MDKKPFRTTRTLANLRQGRNDWYRIVNTSGAAGIPAAQLHIYDEIGYFGVTAGDMLADLAAVPGDLEVHLNTPGGDVWDGIAIYEALKQREGQVGVIVDSLAASIGSVIAMAADPGQLVMAKNASMMIHDGFGMGIGNARDLREYADLLDMKSNDIADIYAERTGLPSAHWREAMQAESWYKADQAVAAGLADSILTRPQKADARLAATFDLSLFRNAPGVRNEKYNADDRKRMAGNGHAMPDGSYPIEDSEDLGNAIHAVGRGGADHDAIRRHIIKRANALGLSSRIPGNWNGDGSINSEPDNLYSPLDSGDLAALQEVLAL